MHLEVFPIRRTKITYDLVNRYKVLSITRKISPMGNSHYLGCEQLSFTNAEMNLGLWSNPVQLSQT